MTTKETIALLKLISNVYPNFKLTEEALGTWQDYLADKTPSIVAGALQTYLNKGEAFPPTLPQLLKHYSDLEKAAWPATAEVMGRMRSPSPDWPEEMRVAAKEAWRMWGGDSRHGMLPDPLGHDNPTMAQSIYDKAMRELASLYEEMLTKMRSRKAAGIPLIDSQARKTIGQRNEEPHPLEQENAQLRKQVRQLQAALREAQDETPEEGTSPPKETTPKPTRDERYATLKEQVEALTRKMNQ